MGKVNYNNDSKYQVSHQICYSCTKKVVNECNILLHYMLQILLQAYCKNTLTGYTLRRQVNTLRYLELHELQDSNYSNNHPTTPTTNQQLRLPVVGVVGVVGLLKFLS